MRSHFFAAAFGTFCCLMGFSASAEEAAESHPTKALGAATPEWMGFTETGADWKTWLTVPVATRHFNRQAVIDDNLSENNPGIGIDRSNGQWHLLGGVYRNSIRQTSVYGLVGYTPLIFDSWSVGAGPSVGLSTGYQNTQKGYPIIPIGGLLVSVEPTRHVGLNLFVVPTLKSFQVEGFAAVQLKVTFD